MLLIYVKICTFIFFHFESWIMNLMLWKISKSKQKEKKRTKNIYLDEYKSNTLVIAKKTFWTLTINTSNHPLKKYIKLISEHLFQFYICNSWKHVFFIKRLIRIY